MNGKMIRVFLLAILAITWCEASRSHLHAAPNEAEELFRQMEQACVQSKTAEIVLQGTLEGNIAGKWKGRSVMAVGNKFRLSIEGNLDQVSQGKQLLKILMVSDGKKSTTASLDPQAPQKIVDASQTFDVESRLMLARAGVLAPMFLLAENVRPGEEPKKFNADEQLTVDGFRFGEMEMVGKKEVRPIHHKLHNRLYQEPLDVTVWVDVKQKRPLKRVVKLNHEKVAITVTESYSKFYLNTPVDEQLFVIAMDGKNPGTLSGTVTLDGKPLVDGKVFFHTDDEIVSVKIEEGRYSSNQVPVGRHKVTVDGDGVHPKYKTVVTTGLEVEIKAGTNVIDFSLEK